MIFRKRNAEKRQYERADYYCLVRYGPLYQKGEYTEILTSLKDLSVSGALDKVKE